MKRLSTLGRATMRAIASGVGVPVMAAMNNLFSPAAPRAASKPKSGRTPADLEAIAKAEAKRARRANRNKESV